MINNQVFKLFLKSESFLTSERIKRYYIAGTDLNKADNKVKF